MVCRGGEGRVVVGNGCVGKTSNMIRQFCKGQHSKKTIGVDFLEKHRYVIPPPSLASTISSRESPV